MGRPEKPVDESVPECARLAHFLRARKAEAGLTYREMSERKQGEPSKATFERAASGAGVPSGDTVDAFIEVTATPVELTASTVDAALDRGHELYIRARRATRAPYYLHRAPDPTIVGGKGHFLQTLRDQHVWAGYPSPGEMERMAGIGELPRSTARRIIQGRCMPVTPRQAMAFLKACEVGTDVELERWLRAGREALKRDRDPKYHEWREAHAVLEFHLDQSAKLGFAA